MTRDKITEGLVAQAMAKVKKANKKRKAASAAYEREWVNATIAGQKRRKKYPKEGKMPRRMYATDEEREELIQALIEAMGEDNQYGGSRKVGDYAAVLAKSHPAAKSIYRHVKKNPHAYSGRVGKLSVAHEGKGKMIMQRAHEPAKKAPKAFTVPKRKKNG